MTQPIKNILPKLIKSLKHQLPHRHSTACLALALCQVQWNLAESDCLVKSVFLSVVLSLMDALLCRLEDSHPIKQVCWLQARKQDTEWALVTGPPHTIKARRLFFFFYSLCCRAFPHCLKYENRKETNSGALWSRHALDSKKEQESMHTHWLGDSGLLTGPGNDKRLLWLHVSKCLLGLRLS